MAVQNAAKSCFRSGQNGHCIQQVTGLPGIFSHVFAHEVPALLARKSREPQILQIAFSVVHDPTQLNRQGPDVGAQYRSAIFYADDTQKRIAEAYIGQLDKSHAFARPIVTRVDPLTGFFPAEDYHQDYLIHNPYMPYIAINNMPKIENLKRTLPELYSGQPVLAKVN